MKFTIANSTSWSSRSAIVARSIVDPCRVISRKLSVQNAGRIPFILFAGAQGQAEFSRRRRHQNRHGLGLDAALRFQQRFESRGHATQFGGGRSGSVRHKSQETVAALALTQFIMGDPARAGEALI